MCFKLIQLTDLHLLADPEACFKGQKPWHNLMAILDAIEQEGWPDLLLLTGDLSQDVSQASYVRLYERLQLTGVPWYWLPGNHDCVDAMQALHPIQFVAVHQGWRLLLLNTQSGQPQGALDMRQRQAILQQLESHRAEPILVALHHQPLLVGEGRLGQLHQSSQDGDEQIQGIDQIPLRDEGWLWQTLSQYSAVKLVLCGHVHQAQQIEREGLTLLTTPATSIQFQAGINAFELDPQPAGYRVIRLEAQGGFTTEVKRLVG